MRVHTYHRSAVQHDGANLRRVEEACVVFQILEQELALGVPGVARIRDGRVVDRGMNASLSLEHTIVVHLHQAVAGAEGHVSPPTHRQVLGGVHTLVPGGHSGYAEVNAGLTVHVHSDECQKPTSDAKRMPDARPGSIGRIYKLRINA